VENVTGNAPRSDGTAGPDRFDRPHSGEIALSGRSLLALQLLSRGYTPTQVARFLETEPADVVDSLNEAAAQLGAGDWHGAVLEAQRRGLLV
jgi:hypothetical protein